MSNSYKYIDPAYTYTDPKTYTLPLPQSLLDRNENKILFPNKETYIFA